MNVLAGVAICLMTALVFLSTVMRYFVGAPLTFSDELVGLLFCCTAFLPVPLALLQRRHIAVDLVVERFPPAARRVTGLLALFIFFAFAGFFVYNAFDFANFSREIGSRSNIGSLLLWPWMMVMPAAFAIAILVALVQLIDALRELAGHAPLMPDPRSDDKDIAERVT